MPEQSDFDDSIRREERRSLHSAMMARLDQKGIQLETESTDSELADLLSAIDEFESAVERAGGDLMVDSPGSSEPERQEFVLPHPADDESVPVYTRRVRSAAAHLRAAYGG